MTSSNNLTVTSASYQKISCSLNGKFFTSLYKLWHQHLHANAAQLSWQYLMCRSKQRDIPCPWDLQLWCQGACKCFWTECMHVKFIIVLRICRNLVSRAHASRWTFSTDERNMRMDEHCNWELQRDAAIVQCRWSHHLKEIRSKLCIADSL